MIRNNNTKKNKYFIITIDTEGDNIWRRVMTPKGMREITVENAKYIERFQLLCEKYHFVPTYLVNYEMAHAEPFVSLAKEWIRENKCEIGMHMHAWNTPPIHDLPFNRKGHNPFAGEYPREILWKKLCNMTKVLEKQFGVRPTSHRGGRWYIDAWYIRALQKLGYEVDCTVTPGISWKKTIGNMLYGPDYRKFPKHSYYMDGRYINKPVVKKDNCILQVPPTIISSPFHKRFQKIWDNPSDIKNVIEEKIWLRPNGHNLQDMKYIVEKTKNREYIEFMLHSSELMPGGSPNFKNGESIEKMYRDLESLFEMIAMERKGISLSGYAHNRKAVL